MQSKNPAIIMLTILSLRVESQCDSVSRSRARLDKIVLDTIFYRKSLELTILRTELITSVRSRKAKTEHLWLIPLNPKQTPVSLRVESHCDFVSRSRTRLDKIVLDTISVSFGMK
jgi:hypothetical protein